MQLRHARKHVRARSRLHIQRRLLMRVLAVGEVEELLVREHPMLRERFVAQPEPARDRRVVTRDLRPRLVRKPVARLLGDRSLRRLELREHRVVALGAHQHRDRAVVLRSRPDHRRAADVDVLDRLLLGHAGACDRLGEGIKVHAHEVDRLDPLALERCHVLLGVPLGEQRRMEARVERLHPPAQDLLLAREDRNVCHLEPRLADRARSAARREQLHAHL